MTSRYIVAGIAAFAFAMMGAGDKAAAQKPGQTVPPYSVRPAAAQGFAMRSIPSEAMLPTVQVGDRVLVVLGISDAQHMPSRGDVMVFKHPDPGDNRVMIKRVVGLPGDTVQMKDGRLWLNGVEVKRTLVRNIRYMSSSPRRIVEAKEYAEQLPGETKPHLIHELDDTECLDATPAFHVPASHVFMMGDNRDFSEDSQAPSGHPDLAKASPESWKNCRAIAERSDGQPAFGFVPLDHLMGIATRIPYSLHTCALDAEANAAGAECEPSQLGK